MILLSGLVLNSSLMGQARILSTTAPAGANTPEQTVYLLAAQQGNKVVDLVGTILPQDQQGSSLELFRSDGSEYYLRDKASRVTKIDLSFSNDSQFKGLIGTLQDYHGDSTFTSYRVTKDGDVIGPRNVIVLKAAPPQKESGNSTSLYNAPSPDIQKDLDPKDKDLSPEAKAAAFMVEVEKLKQDPRFRGIEVSMDVHFASGVGTQVSRSENREDQPADPIGAPKDHFDRYHPGVVQD
jgi:hypothetical protein